MASYNHALFIGAAIESVLSQDFADWELLIVDDGSTDCTREVLASYNDPRINVFYSRFNREVHPRNEALSRAQGRYLAFLNSDNIFLPGKLSLQVEYLERHPDVGAVFTHVTCIGKSGEPLADHSLTRLFEQPNRSRQQWLRHFFTHGNCLCLPSVMVRREAIPATGFDPVLIQLSDWDLWVQLCLEREIWILPDMLTEMRVLPGNRNLSSPSPATNNRTLLESIRVLRHFISPAALEQFLEIFPEFAAWLPSDTALWRQYFVGQLASCHSNKSWRFFGFQALQHLLQDDDMRRRLRQQNPRLMRSFFLSEAAAALCEGPAPTQWVVYVPNETGMYNEKYAYRAWRGFGRQTLCLSFPKPGTAGRIRIDPSDEPISFRLFALRLYDQQSGQLLWRWLPETADEPFITATGRWEVRKSYWTFHGDHSDPQWLLPQMEFEQALGKWLDLEMDVGPDLE